MNTHQVDSIELFKINITKRLHDQYRRTLDEEMYKIVNVAFILVLLILNKPWQTT